MNKTSKQIIKQTAKSTVKPTTKPTAKQITKTKQTIFIGVSWPYANGPLHLGHLAGQHIVVDVFRRYHKKIGNRVLMVSGSDMHGTPITTKALEKGISPYEFALKNHKEFLEIFKRLDLEYDLYTHTHTKNHINVVQTFVKALYKLGYLVPKTTKAFYDPVKKQFLVDRYIEGTCPYCGYSPARGDQCDNCGNVLTPLELKDPVSKLSGVKPIVKQTTDLYFDLPKLQKELEEYLKNKTYWRKHTYLLAKGWLKQGLKPRPITRDLNWGIPVPIKGFENKVVYVWFEAVIGYLSAAILWAKKDKDNRSWEDFWKNKDAKHYYFIAKDNIPFHTLFWPAQLIAFNKRIKGFKKDKLKKLDLLLPLENDLNTPLNLPYNVVANNYLNIKGEKMSKSKGTFITAKDLLDKYPKELIRFFFTRFAPENHDLDFDLDKLVEVNNNELVATIGNFVYRVLVLAKRNYKSLDATKINKKYIDKINWYLEKIGDSIENVSFVKATNYLLELASFGNKMINRSKPWEKPKTDKAYRGIVTGLYVIEALRVAFSAFIPSYAEKLQEMYKISPNFSRGWKVSENIKRFVIKHPKVLVKKLEA